MAGKNRSLDHTALLQGGKLVTEVFDYVAATYPVNTTEVFTYKRGGSSGVTVAIVTVVYTDSTKADLSSVELS